MLVSKLLALSVEYMEAVPEETDDGYGYPNERSPEDIAADYETPLLEFLGASRAAFAS